MERKRFKRIIGIIVKVIITIFVLVTVAYMGLAAMVAKSFFGGGDWSIEQEPWVEVRHSLPNESGEIILLRQNAHPFLAEYFRKIRLEMVGQESVTLSLPMNVGGSTMINVYQYSGTLPDTKTVSFLRLEDHWGKYDIDLINGILLDEDNINLVDGIYLGRFDGQTGELQFVPASEAPEEAIDKISDN
jgi:hypothetical protein